MLMSDSPAPAPPAPAIEGGGAGGSPTCAPGVELDEAAAELLDAVLAEAAAAADERVLRDLKKFAFFRAPWRAASASAARFFAALAAVMEESCVLPLGLPARMLVH